MSTRSPARTARPRWRVVLLGVSGIFLAATLGGCTADAVSGAVSVSPTSSAVGPDAEADAGSDSGADPGALHYPDGASADTPACQDASAAVLTAVNATIENPLPDGANAVLALAASPDPRHAVWLLTGVLPSTPGAEGALVSWATTADPTSDSFAGSLRAVGGTTATVSSAPVIQFPDVAGSGVPAVALRCLAEMPRDSSF